MTETFPDQKTLDALNPPSLSDQDFIQQFEAQTLDPVYFDHQGHLRVSYLYLNLYPLATALKKAHRNIKAYASALGAKDKFNLTLTDALMTLVAQRLAQTADQSWSQFLANNPDLVNNALGVVLSYYSAERLFSDQAKKERLKPDIKPLG